MLPQIALVGRSNVGKSTLLNHLVGRRALAHTSKTPGKTRALNLYAVGRRYYLVDLPGYGYARLSKETRRSLLRTIRMYLAGRKDLAGVVLLFDIRRDPAHEDLAIVDLIAARGSPTLVAVTKADKVSHVHRRERVEAISTALGVPEAQCVVTSARTREGIRELNESLEELIDRSGNV